MRVVLIMGLVCFGVAVAAIISGFLGHSWAAGNKASDIIGLGFAMLCPAVVALSAVFLSLDDKPNISKDGRIRFNEVCTYSTPSIPR